MEWPWQYNFPPFFTLQPNEDTKNKQIEAWCDLILSYCKQKRIYQIDLAEAQNTDLFNNKTIDRKCSIELLTIIFDELTKRGRAQSLHKSSPKKQVLTNDQKYLILWNTLEDWSRIIYEHVDKNALQGTVCTFYELTEAKEMKNKEFFKIDLLVFRKGLEVLEKQNKAEIFQLDGDSEYGKFF